MEPDSKLVAVLADAVGERLEDVSKSFVEENQPTNINCTKAGSNKDFLFIIYKCNFSCFHTQWAKQDSDKKSKLINAWAL